MNEFIQEIKNLEQSRAGIESSLNKRKLLATGTTSLFLAGAPPTKRLRTALESSPLECFPIISSAPCSPSPLNLNCNIAYNPYGSLRKDSLSALLARTSLLQPLLLQRALNNHVQSLNSGLSLIAGQSNFQKPVVPLGEEMLPQSLNAQLFPPKSDVGIPLSIDEDNNWLSEFQCFLRAEFIEIFAATDQDVHIRKTSKKVRIEQVGLRCRFCANCDPDERAARSSAFPSSVRQIYQSFTMMVREHFGTCKAIPPLQKAKFLELKNKSAQGASDSKCYWVYAAKKVGMEDSKTGITMSPESRAAGKATSPFRSTTTASEDEPPRSVIEADDRLLTSDFLYTLMAQVQLINLAECERIGKRNNLPLGLPGFGCRYCCKAGRFGNSRAFASRRCTVPQKARGMYDHFRRCTLCPDEVKLVLNQLRKNELASPPDSEKEKEFFDRLWTRLEINDCGSDCSD